jgi:ribonucleases P/MRP protein subunit RPP40
VPHKKLLAKIQAYGIRSTILQLIDSFIGGRRQRVSLSGVQSYWLPATSGVPQGTVLGPLLFLLYVNDIANDISSEIRHFADACILYRTIRTASDVSTLQADIDKLFNWSVAWQMKFNTAKCHILSITRQ